LAELTLVVAAVASAVATGGSGTDENVPGTFSRVQSPNGQAITKARPTTRFSAMVPSYFSSMW
jgi:hypothetical protein